MAGPVLLSPIPNPPHTSALTTSADSLMSSPDNHVTGGSNAHTSSPRNLSNNLAKKPSSSLESRSKRDRDLLRNQERPNVLGYDLNRSTLTPTRTSISLNKAGDHGADP